MSKKTIMQYFEWYIPNDGKHWKRTAEDAGHLAELGFTDVWLPPAYKGFRGIDDVGYGVYDRYDLGEFDQKGKKRTKYGTKDDYLDAIKALHGKGIKVIADIVLNHMMGADGKETVYGTKVDPEHRYRIIKENKKVEVWTVFEYPGRAGMYSDFKWNSEHITAVDFARDVNTKQDLEHVVIKVNPGRGFSPNVSGELDNFDYLMGVDLDLRHREVREELIRWGKWYLDFTGVDGVRLDALKHMDYKFYPVWLWCIREHKDWNLFAMGEYWEPDIDKLEHEIHTHEESMSMFDVPLHERFYALSLLNDDNDTPEKQQELQEKKGMLDKYRDHLNLRTILKDTLTSRIPERAVAFVDNHDTQPTQPLYSWVRAWFKPLAYALILLMEDPTPCVCYGDLYGIPTSNIPPVKDLEKLLYARQKYAVGDEVTYFDHDVVVGWTRGDSMAVVMSAGENGWKDMKLGKPGQVFVDLLGNYPGEVVIREDGVGEFQVSAKSVSVWVPKE